MHGLPQHKNVLRIGVESVAFQRVLPDTLLELDTGLPLIKCDQALDKETRVLKLSPRFENRLEYFPEDDSVDDLKEELLLFPESGVHDDMVDAYELSHRVANQIFGLNQEDEEDSVAVRIFGPNGEM